jgi:hypothetical protein
MRRLRVSSLLPVVLMHRTSIRSSKAHVSYPKPIPVLQIFKTAVMPSCNLLVEISTFVPGIMADVAYPSLCLSENVRLLKRIAHVFGTVSFLITLPSNSQLERPSLPLTLILCLLV